MADEGSKAGARTAVPVWVDRNRRNRYAGREDADKTRHPKWPPKHPVGNSACVVGNALNACRWLICYLDNYPQPLWAPTLRGSGRLLGNGRIPEPFSEWSRNRVLDDLNEDLIRP